MQAAVGMVTQLSFFMLVIAMAIATAAVAAISQSMGARKPLRAQRYLGLTLSLGMGLCLLTVLPGGLCSTQILGLIRTPPSILELSSGIWIFFLAALPGQYATVFSSAAFRAHRHVLPPLYASMVVFLINLLLDFGLGLGRFGLPALGAEGLALATLVSTLAGAAFNIWTLTRLGLLSRRSFAPLRWQKKAVGYLLKVALPAGAMQFSWQLGYLVLFAVTADLPWDSVNALAGMNAGLRVESILFLPAFAFASTGAILTGHALGAGDKAEARRVGIRVLAAGCGLMSLLALCMWPFAGELSAFMAPSPAVREHALRYILFNLVSTPFGVGSMILGGILGGAGATIYTFVVYGSAIWMIRLPLAWHMGYNVWESSSGIFFAMPVSQCYQFLIILFVFLKCDWTRFALHRQRAPVKNTGNRHDA